MKKILFILTVEFSFIMVFTNCSYAQNAAVLDAFNNSKSFNANIRQLATLESPAKMGDYIADAKTLSTKAIRDFHGRYSEVDNARWYSTSKGIEAYFMQYGYGDRVFYDKKGKWQYSIIFYDETKLPRDIRTSVRSTYYDMAITQVEELQNVEGVAYIIYLQDKSNIKVLKLNREGETAVLQDLKKE